MTAEFGYYAKREGSPESHAHMAELAAAGWGRIGQDSCWGVVFAHPAKPDIVRKVAFAPDRDGWVAYAKWLAAGWGRDNPHFPRIDNLEDHGKFVVADIERLRELSGAGLKHSADYQSASDGAVARSDVTAKAIMSNLSPELMEAVMALRGEFMSRWNMDVHSGNFMLRGETLVMTDPLSYQRGSYEARLAAERKRKELEEMAALNGPLLAKFEVEVLDHYAALAMKPVFAA